MTSTKRTLARFMALWSGFCGAAASCFAKLAFDPDSIVAAKTKDIVKTLASDADLFGGRITVCTLIELVVARGTFLACMILCNAYMLGSFLEGMEESGSVAGTALSTASNFIASACLGFLFWGERFSTLWYTGFAMVLAGVFVLASAGSSNSKSLHPKGD
jgi:drug/metabolite transporter (DMT)-like permease